MTDPFPYPFPQPTAGALSFTDALTQEVTYSVYYKQRWADAWTEATQFDLLSVTWNAAPSFPTAVLRYRYGRVVEIGASVETTREKLSIEGVYIKIVVHCVDGDRPWWGFVQDTADEQHGILARRVVPPPPDDPFIVNEAAGIQTFSCVGMIAALDRAPMSRTYFQCTTPFSRSGTDNYRAAWSAPLFNVAPDGRRNRRDPFAQKKMPELRTTGKPDVPSFTGAALPTANQRQTYRHWFPYLYGNNDNAGARWKLGEVLEYLAAYNAPRVDWETDAGIYDGQSEFVPVWIFDHDILDPDNATQTQYADWWEPVLDCDQLTLKGALDRLLSNEAGHGYWVWVDETKTPHRVYVEPFTTITSAATIDDENGAPQNFPANPRIVNLQTATDSATGVSVQSVGATSYTAIMVQGAPEVVVCTLDIPTHFDNGWSSALNTKFNTEISGLNPAKLRDLYRIRDIRELAEYRPIGRDLKIKNTFNWKTAGGIRPYFYDRYVEDYLGYGMRVRILDELPLREGVDYAVDPADAVTAHNAARTKTMPASIYGRSFIPTGELTGKFVCWTTRARRDVLADLNDPNYKLDLQELAHELTLGISIDVTNAYQGILEAGGGRVAPHMPRLTPTSLLLTVAIQTDRRFIRSLRNPNTFDSVDQEVFIDADRIKVFDLGDRLQRIEVLPATVTGIDESAGVLHITGDAFYLRDDTALAQQIVKFLASYYFKPKAVVRLASRRATAKLWPGQMIGTVNAGTPHAVTSNALVSEVSITFGVGLNGQYTRPNFTVQTSFGELDPLQFFPRLST